MPGDQLGHLEHADLLLAVEHRFQVLVGVDQGPLFGVLQTVLADVGPELFRQLGPGKGFLTDNLGEHDVRADRLHERRVWCSFCFFRCFGHALYLPFSRGECNKKIPGFQGNFWKAAKGVGHWVTDSL